MSSDQRNDRGSRQGGQGGGRRFVRARKSCKFCAEKIDYIDYKDARMLSSFVPERGKIQPRRISGTCSTHQRMLAAAIKRGRNAAILPFATD